MIFRSKKPTIKLPQSIQLNTQLFFIKITGFIDFCIVVIFDPNDINTIKK